MSTNRCKGCGLANFADAVECKRCGTPLFGGKKKSSGTKGASPRSFSVFRLLVYVVIAAAAYYFFTRPSTPDVAPARAASVPMPSDAKLAETRSEMDRQRNQRIANAVGAAPGIAAQEAHNRETEKMLRGASNTSQR